jgi:hypothetical protein
VRLLSDPRFFDDGVATTMVANAMTWVSEQCVSIAAKRKSTLMNSDPMKAQRYVIDLGSTNGTMLNGVKISGEQKLRHGDALMFGSTPARFEVA